MSGRPRLFSFPRPVWLLGFVSLLTDTASEAIYPLLPGLLMALGATPLSMGAIEGSAEAIASLAKVASGHISDRWRRRQPLVLAGYGLASLVRPLLALVTAPWHVWSIRFVDRIGKGVRGGPRDALLAHYAPAGQRGRVFGFHRAMDHAGAVLGPLIAAGFLILWPGHERALFAWTIVPGLIVILLVLWVRDPEPGNQEPGTANRALGTEDQGPRTDGALPSSFWRLMSVLALFTLGNSSDLFLLLYLGQQGMSPLGLTLLWAAQHVVKSVSSVAGGRAADRLGRRPLIASGWILYAGVYAAFALATSLPALVAIFLIYGLYHGLTEGAEKALIADAVPASTRATAFGIYGATLGLGAFAASLLFGFIWMSVSPAAAFFTGAALALAATAALTFVRVESPIA